MWRSRNRDREILPAVGADVFQLDFSCSSRRGTVPDLAGVAGAGEYREIAARVIRVEQQSRHSMIYSFEKMAMRDAAKSTAGARRFACGLFDYLHGTGSARARLSRWVEAVASLPRKQTRVLTWPLVTVFGFVANPRVHIFLKPTVTRAAAQAYGFQFKYESRPNWGKSFMWVLGSSEYD